MVAINVNNVSMNISENDTVNDDITPSKHNNGAAVPDGDAKALDRKLNDLDQALTKMSKKVDDLSCGSPPFTQALSRYLASSFADNEQQKRP